MAKTRVMALAGVVLVAAVAGYWYWSPHLALRTMRQAAMENDAETLNEHVDYPRLRESMKGQFAAAMADKMAPKPGDNSGFAAFGAMLGQALVDKMVDGMVRPEFVMRAMQDGKLRAGPQPGSSASAASAPAPTKAPTWTTERRGADKFFVWSQAPGETPDKRFGLVLERSGFATWKLTEVRLPAL